MNGEIEKNNKILDFYNKWIPKYARLPLWIILAFNMLCYFGTKLINMWYPAHSVMLPIDEKIPLIPATILIYVSCFPYWVIGYIMITRIDKEKLCRFAAAEMLGKAICALFFIFYPTTRIRPEIVGDGFFEFILRFIYAVDTPVNLFPSVHCLISWYCYIAVRGDKRVPLVYRIFTFVYAFAIFAATLTTAQHVILDVIAGVLLAEICWFISGHTKLPNLTRRLFEFAEPIKEKFFVKLKKTRKKSEADHGVHSKGL